MGADEGEATAVQKHLGVPSFHDEKFLLDPPVTVAVAETRSERDSSVANRKEVRVRSTIHPRCEDTCYWLCP